jgi:hypothetical protein
LVWVLLERVNGGDPYGQNGRRRPRYSVFGND